MIKLKRATGSQMPRIRSLYKSAFPKVERKPFLMLLAQQRKGVTEILAVTNDEGDFLGMVVVVQKGDLALVDYLAIENGSRGDGVGSQVLTLLKERYSTKRLFLEIEKPGIGAENEKQRRIRKEFYSRNGFTHNGVSVNAYGIEEEILTYDCSVSFTEFCEMLKRTQGRLITKIINPKIISDDIE